MTKLPDKKYVALLKDLKQQIRQARQRAVLAVNAQLLSIYWLIGKTILEQQSMEGWGTKIIDRLSADLKLEFPDMRGLSIRNLKYMRAFAEAYPEMKFVQSSAAQIQEAGNQDSTIVQQLAAQLPWGHHQLLLDKVKDMEERLFYISKAVENGWSRDVLAMQVESQLYHRQGKAITNFPVTMPAIDSDLAIATFKSPYSFDFLMIGEEAKERDVERALVQHLKKFMLELGKGFAYVGNQYNLFVGEDEFALDLFFYNYTLHRFVIFELKIGDFKPEYAGKLNFYINTVDAQIKGERDDPTIGILLCKAPNKLVVQYSLKGINTPIGVSEYQLKKGIPKVLKGELPSIEELEAEIDKEYNELKSPAGKRLEVLKQKLGKINSEELQTQATTKILFDLIDNSVLPLYKELLKKLQPFKELFHSSRFFWQTKDSNIDDLNLLPQYWKDEEYLKAYVSLHSYFILSGFKKAGVDAFSVDIRLDWVAENYYYGFAINNYNNNQVLFKKLYHEQLSGDDIYQITETVNGCILDEIEKQLGDKFK